MALQLADDELARSARRLDITKKWFRCLRCGRRMWTDRCHRFCSRCSDVNAEIVAMPFVRVEPENSPITLAELGCYGLELTARQTCGEVELTLDP